MSKNSGGGLSARVFAALAAIGLIASSMTLALPTATWRWIVCDDGYELQRSMFRSGRSTRYGSGREAAFTCVSGSGSETVSAWLIGFLNAVPATILVAVVAVLLLRRARDRDKA